MSYDESSLCIKPLNLTSKSVDMSVDDSMILNDIRNIFETSASTTTEFVISKPIQSMYTFMIRLTGRLKSKCINNGI